MRIAESVTFGGGGVLDRRAHLRGDAGALEKLRADPEARAAIMWRGRFLMNFAEATQSALARLKMDHPLVRRYGAPLFLGVEPAGPRFACDMSDWQPEGGAPEQEAFFDTTRQGHPDLPDILQFAGLRAQMAALSAPDAELAVTIKGIFGWHATHRFCANCGAPSQVAMAGWQRLCPACGSHHFPRTDPVVIMLITHGEDLLLGRSPGWPDRMYSLLAGFMEPGETIEFAVRREVAEETGIGVGAVGYLASQPWPFPSSLMIGCRGTALTRDISLDPAELDDAIWMSRNELARVLAGTSERIIPAREGAIARFLMTNWLADRLD